MRWKRLYYPLGAHQHLLGLGTKEQEKYLLIDGVFSALCTSLSLWVIYGVLSLLIAVRTNYLETFVTLLLQPKLPAGDLSLPSMLKSFAI